MKKHSKKVMFFLASIVLLAIATTASWVFGWTKGSLHALNFDAGEVEQIVFSCDNAQMVSTNISDPEDIQALIDTINSFDHKGNMLRKGFFAAFSSSSGGHIRYVFQVMMKTGESVEIVLTQRENDYFSPEEDRDMSFYCSTEKVSPLPLCRGNVSLFFNLYHKYHSA